MTFGVAEEDIMSLNDQAFAAHESAIASAKRREVMLGGLAAFLLGAAPVHAQQAWPSRAIRVVVPFSAGGAADTSARAYSVPLNDILGQSVVIENRTGGNAVVAAGAVLGAPRDGYTFILDAANCITNPVLLKDLPFDYATAFVPVTLASRAPQVVAVRHDFPAANIGEFLDYVRAHPAKVSCGTPPSGGMAHLALALLEERAGVKFIHTPYRGGADAARDIMGGQIDSILITASSARGPHKAGKARVLAVTSEKRSSAFPDVPTLAESGFPGYDMDDWYGLFAATGVAPEVVSQMQQAVAKAARSPALMENLDQAGQVPVGNTSAECSSWLDRQRPLLQQLVRRAGITVS